MCVLLSGIKSEDVAVFGNRWIVDLPHEPPCPAIDDDFPGPCSSESEIDVSMYDNVECDGKACFFFILLFIHIFICQTVNKN